MKILLRYFPGHTTSTLAVNFKRFNAFSVLNNLLDVIKNLVRIEAMLDIKEIRQKPKDTGRGKEIVDGFAITSMAMLVLLNAESDKAQGLFFF